MPIFAAAHGVKVVQAARQKLIFPLEQVAPRLVVGKQHFEGPADDFVRGVTIQALRTLFPAVDDAMQVSRNNCVLRGVDDRREQQTGFLGRPFVSDVAERNDDAG